MAERAVITGAGCCAAKAGPQAATPRAKNNIFDLISLFTPSAGHQTSLLPPANQKYQPICLHAELILRAQHCYHCWSYHGAGQAAAQVSPD